MGIGLGRTWGRVLSRDCKDGMHRWWDVACIALGGWRAVVIDRRMAAKGYYFFEAWSRLVYDAKNIFYSSTTLTSINQLSSNTFNQTV